MTKLLDRSLLCSLLSILSVVLIGPGQASAQGSPWAVPLTVVAGSDVTLYEAMENTRFVGGKVVRRQAISALMGVAASGTPLCPLPRDPNTTCTVNAVGADNISLTTGLGPVAGIVTVVTQDSSPDSPEIVVATGRFAGNMDFSPAVLYSIPYGTIVGTMTLDSGARVPFTGTFRLPFVYSGALFYLTNPATFGVTPVKPNEYALGYPTVRFEIKF